MEESITYAILESGGGNHKLYILRKTRQTEITKGNKERAVNRHANLCHLPVNPKCNLCVERNSLVLKMFYLYIYIYDGPHAPMVINIMHMMSYDGHKW